MRLKSGTKQKWLARSQNVADDPGCVKTLRGITAPGILGSTVMRRAKKRKNLSSARHYDQIRFRFHTAKTLNEHPPDLSNPGLLTMSIYDSTSRGKMTLGLPARAPFPWEALVWPSA
jgi:hypothetical protein